MTGLFRGYPRRTRAFVSLIEKENDMYLESERQDVVIYCKKLVTAGLTTGTGGNISVFNDKAGHFAISPSGVDYTDMTPEDVVVCDLDGKVVDGSLKPSSEIGLHRIFYRRRPDIKAVVHTHSTYATVLATLREDLPASSYLIAYAGVNVRCADYASYGTEELAEKTFEAMTDRHCALMANHGLVAGDADIASAFAVAEQIEHCCEVYVKARSIGSPVLLSEDEMRRTEKRFRTSYGQK